MLLLQLLLLTVRFFVVIVSLSSSKALESRQRILFVVTSFDRGGRLGKTIHELDKLDYVLMIMDEIRDACEVRACFKWDGMRWDETGWEERRWGGVGWEGKRREGKREIHHPQASQWTVY